MENFTIHCFQESSFPAPLPLGIISVIAEEWHSGQGIGPGKPLCNHWLQWLPRWRWPIISFSSPRPCLPKGISVSSWLTRHGEKGLPMSQLSI